MKTRVITAVVGLPLLILLIWLGDWWLTACVLFLSVVGIYEYAKAVGTGLERPVSLPLIITLTVVLLLVMNFDYYAMVPYLVASVMICLCWEVFTAREFERAAYTIFGLMYVPMMFGYLMLFQNLRNGEYFIWMVFVAAFSTDTFAYLVGRMLKGKKLAPDISPNKTISGSVGGLVASVVLMTVYGLVMTKAFGISIPLWAYAALGGAASVAGQLGDLSASLIKRRFNVKDFGKILPGHGGILDRFDSVLFIIPIVYLFAVLMNG